MSERDALNVAAFVADLERVAPRPDEATDLPLAVDEAVSLNQHFQKIDARLRFFEAFAASSAAYPEVRDLCRELDLRATIEQGLARATSGLTARELGEALPRASWRLNSGDFGPQNMLFDDTGRLTVVDFEAGGWDDPAHLVMGFVAHDTSADLAIESAAAFLGAYAAAVRLSLDQIHRFERVGLLCDIEWIAIYASALTATTVAIKQFNNPDLDVHAYLTSAIARLKRRVARAANGTGYPIDGCVSGSPG
jgi:hypothetical protein